MGNYADLPILVQSEVNRAIIIGTNNATLYFLIALSLVGIMAAIYVRLRYPEFYVNDPNVQRAASERRESTERPLHSSKK